MAAMSAPLPMRVAFAYSINTVAVRLAQEVGTRAVADMAQRFGITTHVGTNPSMALGTSAVRLIDMTRAYAAVARGGVAVTPYGIRRVTTADGTLLYQHQDDNSRVLVAPWVAAQMTDLLQGVVLHGTGRAADIGRPTAGKTGTTTSNKDGWFIGFSSGLTTGIWFGRDDNRALPGLAGGRAPARAFHDFMVRAVANRPVEAFTTDAAAPDWQSEGDNQIWYAPPDDQPLVDADGNPIEPGTPPPADNRPGDPDEATPPKDEQPERLDQEWLDRAIERPPRAPPRRGRPARRHSTSRAARRGGARRPRAEPGARRPRVGAEQGGDQRVEIRAVVEVDEVGDFVRDRRPADEVRRQDQPPAVADRARARAAAPARHRIADPDPRDLDAGPMREFAGLAAEQVERMGFQPAQQAALEPVGGAARDQPALAALDPPRPRRIPVEPVRRAIERDDRARRERHDLGDRGQRPLDPGAVAGRPGQRAARRRPLRHGQRHRAGARIDAEPHPPRPRRHAQVHGRAAENEFRAHGRRDDVRGRRRRLPRSSSRAPTCRPRAPSRGCR